MTKEKIVLIMQTWGVMQTIFNIIWYGSLYMIGRIRKMVENYHLAKGRNKRWK